ncbi:hemolysin [Arcanobacterium haemolyticum]|uniref:Channel protein, hemolysin III family n=2 Tax=Arcanobacterium haemolyticum TaxID=28264 RepID=D7BKM5_ARCHD|nr:channel protein, hemolysin III family [Arcanobacterium haemolyticum DSM 20595]SPT75715.1 hemolysin [Arcanobacterium haemolyticum]SQH28036.1 hemolysin [Arcanobacterium haemolyticum]
MGSQEPQIVAALPKPRLRGWIHALTAPLALANGILLTVFAPDAGAVVGCVVFMVASFFLFANSGIYHIGTWSPRMNGILRRIDHANIFLLIAGTYTPLAVMLLDPWDQLTVLSIVWGGAFAGSLMHIVWIDSPRWLYVPLYIALSWVALWYLPEFWDNGSPAIVWLLFAGGLSYTVGALFYGFKWPNPWPRMWGFHEFFHLGTLGGFACQVVAVWLALFA